MPINENLNENQTFINTAMRYLKRNWSVIPVWGSSQPEQSKVAALRWSPFTQTRASQDILHHWFGWAGHQGIAIITGPISCLAVLDFDSLGICRDFCDRYPQLAKTYMVQTPRGYHLYYRIPENCHTKSLKGQGIDWQWEGRYVVAPPTQGYSIKNDQNLRLLSQRDITTIENFIQGLKPSKKHYEPPTKSITTSELKSLYGNYAHQGQRNQALFQSALTARDRGWSLQDTIATLAPMHTHNRIATESVEARQREAIATLKSAFSRPPRPNTGIRQLPNTIREKLLSLKQTHTIRVIEGLRLKGYEAGIYISWQESWSVLEGIVGRDSILNTFHATNEVGQSLFECITGYVNPSPQPPTPVDTAINVSTNNDNKCLLVSYSNSGKSQEMGSPTHYFRLPSNVELTRLLGVQLSSITDILSLDDLKSAKTTRQALHFRFIERRPGKYSTQWLAKRLGVSKITKNRYDKVLEGLHKRANYTRKHLYWNNLNEIPDKFDVPGQFLEDETGKRYPAKRALAGKLMKQKHKLTLCKQGYNSYWVGSRFDMPIEQKQSMPQKPAYADAEPWREQTATYWQDVWDRPVSEMPFNAPKPTQIQHELRSATHPSQREKSESKSPDSLREHNPKRKFEIGYIEEAAQHLKDQINNGCQVGQGISMSRMRQLISCYNLAEVRRVVKQVCKRDEVQNPPGLLIVILRSEARIAELKSS